LNFRLFLHSFKFIINVQGPSTTPASTPDFPLQISD
jgi:hypothetical protein